MPPSKENSQNPPAIFFSFLPPPMTLMSNNQSTYIKNSQNSQTFPSIPPNNSAMFRRPPNNFSGAQSSNDEVEMQFPQFSIQVGLLNITFEERENSTKINKTKYHVIYTPHWYF